MTLKTAFLDQASHCEALGSPFMGQLCRVLGDRWTNDLPLAEKFGAWQGDIGPLGASLPLRLAGGFHALVLADQDATLTAAYPPHSVSDDTLWSAISTAMRTHATFLDRWTDSAPQTNEVRRSAALIAAGHWLASRYALPLTLSELGASGGLNLMWDHFALDINGHSFGPDKPALHLAPDWSGPMPPQAHIDVANRRGVDLNPLVASDTDDALRLMAYLWPDQPDRLDRTRAAIAIHDAPVDKGDAIDWLVKRLSQPHDSSIHLIYHTIAWQYFPPAHQARGQAMIEAAGAKATADAPLAWFAMENDGAGNGAALTLRLWPGNHRIQMGRADFHGRWIDWTSPAP